MKFHATVQMHFEANHEFDASDKLKAWKKRMLSEGFDICEIGYSEDREESERESDH